MHIYLRNQLVANSSIITRKGDIFQAIADPTRRAILVLIATQAMTPNAMAQHFDTTRQAVSKHIKVLTDCQLLTYNKTGREIIYHFNPTKLKEIDFWLQQFKKHWEDRFDQLDELLINLNTTQNEK